MSETKTLRGRTASTGRRKHVMHNELVMAVVALAQAVITIGEEMRKGNPVLAMLVPKGKFEAGLREIIQAAPTMSKEELTVRGMMLADEIVAGMKLLHAGGCTGACSSCGVKGVENDIVQNIDVVIASARELKAKTHPGTDTLQ